MVDERDTSTWPAVLQVTVWVALQVSSLISTQFLAGLVGQRDTSKSLTVLQVSCRSVCFLKVKSCKTMAKHSASK